MDSREADRNPHPPNCTCVDCINRRLGIITHHKHSPLHHPINKQRQPDYKQNVRNGTPIQQPPQSIPKPLKILSKLGLNLLLLTTIGLLIWSSIKAFSHQWTPAIGCTVVIGTLTLFILLCIQLSKWKYRKPSMKLTVFGLTLLFLITAFSGVEPMSSYKDIALNKLSTIIEQVNNPHQSPATPPPVEPIIPPVTPTVTQPTNYNNIDTITGVYENYYLGLVNTSDGILSGSGCYDDTGNFIVLINNKEATDPTYNELVSFLQEDKTDEFPYEYTNPMVGFYYGTAESHVNLTRIKDIIDGNIQPDKPNICDDFAERLHNEAELAGIKCAYVTVDISGYTDPYNYGIPSNTGHALDAFQTIDRGLVYIDDTNSPGPIRNVATVNVVVGQAYIPILLFNDAGWQSLSMGTVTNIELTWDGTWNN